MFGLACAGEASGDQILAPILSRLNARVAIEFAGISGPAMQAAGVYPLFPMERLSVMGIFEVLPRLPELVSIRRQMAHYLEVARPCALITCDAPDFNLTLAARAKSMGIPAIHVVSPSVWAWRADRIPKIAKQLDGLLCLFPFEPALYAGTGLKTAFIGHPLVQQIDFNPEPFGARSALGLDHRGPLLAMLPGSRMGEVKRLLPVFLAAFDQAVQAIPDLVGMIPASGSQLFGVIQSLVGQRPIEVVHGQSRQVMAAANAVLAASGTAVLESVLTGRPTVAAYRMHPLTHSMVRNRLTTAFVTLPNYMANRALVPELIQSEATPGAISAAVLSRLHEGPGEAFLRDARQLYDSLSGPVTERASSFIETFL